MEKTDDHKKATDRLLEKSKALRAKSKEVETKLNDLKAKVEEFIHPDKDSPKSTKEN